MKFKKTFMFILFLIMGILIGSVIAMLCKNVSFLSWLALGETIGVGIPDPISIDLAIVTLAFGFSININVAYLSLDVFFSITPLITLDCTIPVALYCLSSLLLHFWGAEKIRWMEASPAFPEEGSRAHPSKRHQFFLK